MSNCCRGNLCHKEGHRTRDTLRTFGEGSNQHYLGKPQLSQLRSQQMERSGFDERECRATDQISREIGANGAPPWMRRVERTAPKTDLSFVARTSSENGTARVAASGRAVAVESGAALIGGAPRAATAAETSGAHPQCRKARDAYAREQFARRASKKESFVSRERSHVRRHAERRSSSRGRDASPGSPSPRRRRDGVAKNDTEPFRKE